MPRGSRLLSGHAFDVAPRLLGARVTSDIGGQSVTIRVTEVEAYGGQGEDPGSHAYRGRTPRNATMFGPAGHAYVYFTYGMHWCFNVVTGPLGSASAVLIRAGEVIAGADVARDRRPSSRVDIDLARGPARLATALAIDGACDGVDLLDPNSPLRLVLGPVCTPSEITRRTGVSGPGGLTEARFVLDHPSVSAYRPAPTRQ